MKWAFNASMLLFTVFMPALAANESASADKTEPQVASVIVNGEILFHVRGVTAYPAKLRATTIAKRIVALEEDESFDPNTLRIEEMEDRSKILAGDQNVVSVLDIDTEFEGLSRN